MKKYLILLIVVFVAGCGTSAKPVKYVPDLSKEDIVKLKEADEKHNKGRGLLNDAVKNKKDSNIRNSQLKNAEKVLREAVGIYEQLHAKYEYKELEERLVMANEDLYLTLKFRTLR